MHLAGRVFETPVLEFVTKKVSTIFVHCVRIGRKKKILQISVKILKNHHIYDEPTKDLNITTAAATTTATTTTATERETIRGGGVRGFK